jgi:hypothetical protein
MIAITQVLPYPVLAGPGAGLFPIFGFAQVLPPAPAAAAAR